MEIDFEKFFSRLKAEKNSEYRRDLIRIKFTQFQHDGYYVECFESILKNVRPVSKERRNLDIISEYCRLLPDDITPLCKGQLCDLFGKAFLDLPSWRGRFIVLDKLLKWKEADYKFIFKFSISVFESNKDFEDNEFERLIKNYYHTAKGDINGLIEEFKDLKSIYGKNRKIDEFIKKVEKSLQIEGLEHADGPQIRRQYFSIVDNKHLDKNIILLGPSGVGKTTIAKIIHRNSLRHKGDMKIYSCDQGERVWQRLLDDVSGDDLTEGSIFLDEVHMLDNEIQTRLVTMFEEKKIRVISASSMPIVKLKNRMFIDFWRRIDEHEVEIRPLWKRKSDLRDFLKTCANKMNKMEIDDGAIDALMGYKWENNYSGIRNFFGDICPVLINHGHKCISKSLLKKYKTEFPPSPRDIINKCCK